MFFSMFVKVTGTGDACAHATVTSCEHPFLVCEHTVRGLRDVSLISAGIRGTAPYTNLKTLLEIIMYVTGPGRHLDMIICLG